MNPTINKSESTKDAEESAAIADSIQLGKEHLQNDIDSIVQQNTKINPDKAGETAEKSQKVGFSFELGMANEETLNKTVKTQELNSLNLPTTAPVLANQIASNQQLAQVSHDDLPELARVEQEIKKADITASSWKGFKDYITAGTTDIANKYKAAWMRTREFHDLLLKKTVEGELSDTDSKKLEYLRGEIHKLQGSDSSYLGTLASMVGTVSGIALHERTLSFATVGVAAGSVVPGLGNIAGALEGYGVGFMTTMFEMYVTDNYDKHVNNGVDRKTALALASWQALVETALDYAGGKVLGGRTKYIKPSQSTALITEEAARRMESPLAKHKIMQYLGRKGMAGLKLFGINKAKQIVDEMDNEAALYSKGEPSRLETKEGRKEIADRLTENILEEVAVSFTLGMFAGKAKEKLASLEAIMGRREYRAAEKEGFRDIEAAVLATKTKKRSATTTESFLAKQFENTGIKNVHVKSDVFNEIIARQEIPIEQLETYIPGITEQIKANEIVKGDIIIPLSNYLAYFSGTETGDALNEHISFTQTFAETAEPTVEETAETTEENTAENAEETTEETAEETTEENAEETTEENAEEATEENAEEATEENAEEATEENAEETTEETTEESTEESAERERAEARLRILEEDIANSEAAAKEAIDAFINETHSNLSTSSKKFYSGILTAFVNSHAILNNIFPHEALGKLDLTSLTLNESSLTVIENALSSDFGVFVEATSIVFKELFTQTQPESIKLELQRTKMTGDSGFGSAFGWFLEGQAHLFETDNLLAKNYVYFLAGLRKAEIESRDRRTSLMLTAIEQSVAAVEDSSKEIVVIYNEDLAPETVAEFNALAVKGKWEAIKTVLKQSIASLGRNPAEDGDTLWRDEYRNQFKAAERLKIYKVIANFKEASFRANEMLEDGGFHSELDLLTYEALHNFIDENPDALPYTREEIESALDGRGHDILGEQPNGSDFSSVEEISDYLEYSSPTEFIRELVEAPPVETYAFNATDNAMLQKYGTLNGENAVHDLLSAALDNEYIRQLNARQIIAFFDLNTTTTAIAKALKEIARKAVADVTVSTLETKTDEYRELLDAKKEEYRQVAELSDLNRTIELLKNVEVVRNIMQRLTQTIDAEAEFIKTEAVILDRENHTLVETGYGIKNINLGRAILAQFGLITGVNAENLETYIADITKYDRDILENEKFLWAVENATDYGDLTLDVFDKLLVYVKGAVELARDESRVNTATGWRNLNDVVSGLLEGLEESTADVESIAEAETASDTEIEKTPSRFTRIHDSLIIAEHLLYEMDGHRYGAFTQAIATPMFNGLNDYQVENAKILQPLVTSLRSLDLKKGVMEVDGLNVDGSKFVFGKETGGSAKLEILTAILSTGNESSYKKLLIGRGWGTEVDGILDDSRWVTFMEDMISNQQYITIEDMNWVQSVWDAYAGIFPEVQSAFREINGYNTAEISNREISTPLGTFSGGYVPANSAELKYIPKKTITVGSLKKSVTSEDIEFNQSFSAIPTRRPTGETNSFTTERTDSTQALTLDLSVILAAFDDQLKYIHLYPPATNVLKILGNNRFRTEIEKRYPHKIDHVLAPFVKNTISQKVTVENPQFELINKTLGAIRRTSSTALLALNVKNVLEQVTGLYAAATDLNLKEFGAGLIDSLFSTTDTADFINEKSNFMSLRAKDAARILREEINRLAVGKGIITKGLDLAAEKGLILQHKFQNIIDRAVWITKFKEVMAKQREALETRDLNSALYNEIKDLSPAEREKKAVEEADHIIRHVLENFNAASYSTVQFGNPAWRSFLQFYSYPNKLYNLLLSNFKKAWGQEKLTDRMKGILGNVVGLYLFAATISKLTGDLAAWIFRGFQQKEEEDKYEEIGAFMEYGVLPATNLGLGFIPFGGSVSHFMGSGHSLISSPTVGWAEDTLEGAAAMFNLATDDDKERLTDKEIRQIFRATSVLPAFNILYPLMYNLHLSQMYDEDETY